MNIKFIQIKKRLSTIRVNQFYFEMNIKFIQFKKLFVTSSETET